VALKFDPQGNMLATCGLDLLCRIWSEIDGYWMCTQEIELEKQPASLCWSPHVGSSNSGSLLLAIGSEEGTVSLFLISSLSAESAAFNGEAPVENLGPKQINEIRCHSMHPVKHIAIHSSGTLMATGCSKSNGLINFWCLEQGLLVNTYTGPGGVSDICWIGENALAAGFTRSRVISLFLFRIEFSNNSIL